MNRDSFVDTFITKLLVITALLINLTTGCDCSLLTLKQNATNYMSVKSNSKFSDRFVFWRLCRTQQRLNLDLFMFITAMAVKQQRCCMFVVCFLCALWVSMQTFPFSYNVLLFLVITAHVSCGSAGLHFTYSLVYGLNLTWVRSLIMNALCLNDDGNCRNIKS